MPVVGADFDTWDDKSRRGPVLPAFPSNLAKIVIDRWHTSVGGEYTPPPCPSERLLRRMLEICYLASTTAEEGRYPQFNIVAFPDEYDVTPLGSRILKFRDSRPLNLGEIRRLAPAVDLKKSAIWVTWTKQEWSIPGLLDLGTSWYRAREGLAYRYNHANNLLVQIDGPGRLHVYQGPYLVATLADGELRRLHGIEVPLFLHEPANAALTKMAPAIDWPDYEQPKEFEEFTFMALWNTYAAIANAISAANHGGMLVIAKKELPNEIMRVKYKVGSDQLRDAFVKFINARHLQGDYIELESDGHCVPEIALYKAEIDVRESYDAFVEATRFVAGLAGCDGSIVISDDLRLSGFGGEIRAELAHDTPIFETANDFQRDLNLNLKACDIEQFGMRHRAAVKLASQDHGCRILAISQDGPISGIWWERGKVLVRKGVRLVNMNMPWA